VILNKLKELKENNIKICLDNYEDWKLSDVKKIKPNYLKSVYKRNLSNPSLKLQEEIKKLSKEINDIEEIGLVINIYN
jgi:hypothetical protein